MMRILYYFKDYATPMYQWQHVHIIDELYRHECFIEVFNPLLYDSQLEANEALLRRIDACGIDLFMTPHNEDDLYIETVEQIKRKGIPTLLICFDNLVVPFVHFGIAPHFDLVWLTSRETQYMFDRRGCNTIFLPYAANPNLRRAQESITGIGFVGTPYGSRANMINALTEGGIEVYCHCLKPDSQKDAAVVQMPTSSLSKTKLVVEFLRFEQGRTIIRGAIKNRIIRESKLYERGNFHKLPVVAPEELYTVYPRYSLALSSTSARNTGVLKNPLQIVNLRSFEIPMAGGLQICQYSEELAEYFEEDKEILFYRCQEELVEKAHFYCSHLRDGDREKIRNAARKRAVCEHTWYRRFEKVFVALGIPKPNES